MSKTRRPHRFDQQSSSLPSLDGPMTQDPAALQASINQMCLGNQAIQERLKPQAPAALAEQRVDQAQDVEEKQRNKLIFDGSTSVPKKVVKHLAPELGNHMDVLGLKGQLLWNLMQGDIKGAATDGTLGLWSLLQLPGHSLAGPLGLTLGVGDYLNARADRLDQEALGRGECVLRGDMWGVTHEVCPTEFMHVDENSPSVEIPEANAEKHIELDDGSRYRELFTLDSSKRRTRE